MCNFASKKAAKWTFFVFVGPMSHHFQVLQKNFRSLFVYTTRRLPLRPQRQCLLLNSHTNSFLEIKSISLGRKEGMFDRHFTYSAQDSHGSNVKQDDFETRFITEISKNIL